MIKLGSNNGDMKDMSFIKIEPIVNQHPSSVNDCTDYDEEDDDDDYVSCLEQSSSEDKETTKEEEQTTITRKDESELADVMEQIENKMDLKIRNHSMEINKRIDLLSIAISSNKSNILCCSVLKIFKIVFFLSLSLSL